MAYSPCLVSTPLMELFLCARPVESLPGVGDKVTTVEKANKSPQAMLLNSGCCRGTGEEGDNSI